MSTQPGPRGALVPSLFVAACAALLAACGGDAAPVAATPPPATFEPAAARAFEAFTVRVAPHGIAPGTPLRARWSGPAGLLDHRFAAPALDDSFLLVAPDVVAATFDVEVLAGTTIVAVGRVAHEGRAEFGDAASFVERRIERLEEHAAQATNAVRHGGWPAHLQAFVMLAVERIADLRAELAFAAPSDVAIAASFLAVNGALLDDLAALAFVEPAPGGAGAPCPSDVDSVAAAELANARVRAVDASLANVSALELTRALAPPLAARAGAALALTSCIALERQVARDLARPFRLEPSELTDCAGVALSSAPPRRARVGEPIELELTGLCRGSEASDLGSEHPRTRAIAESLAAAAGIVERRLAATIAALSLPASSAFEVPVLPASGARAALAMDPANVSFIGARDGAGAPVPVALAIQAPATLALTLERGAAEALVEVGFEYEQSGVASPSFHRLSVRILPSGTLEDLGASIGDSDARATAIAPDGMRAAGSSRDGDRRLAVRFEGGGVARALGSLSGHANSGATGIGGGGAAIVGWSGPASDPRASLESRAFHWSESAGLRALDGLSGYSASVANSVSACGSLAAGVAFSSSGSRAVRWSRSGGVEDLGALPGHATSEASGISAAGSIVVGWSSRAGSHRRAFRWTEGLGMTSLPPLPGHASSEARGVSGDGLVAVGRSVLQSSARAVRWHADGVAEDLGALPGDSSSCAEGASFDGAVVVGWSSNGSTTRAFRWSEASGMIDLGALPGLSNAVAEAVSADGTVIAGTADDGTATRAFRWTMAR